MTTDDFLAAVRAIPGHYGAGLTLQTALGVLASQLGAVGLTDTTRPVVRALVAAGLEGRFLKQFPRYAAVVRRVAVESA